MRLTIIPPVMDGESAAAHLLRAFDINGEPWSRERLKKVGHSLTDILQGRADQPLADRLGRSEKEFLKWSPAEVTKRKVLIGSEQLHRDDWTTSERRWCPCCWKNDLCEPSLGRHGHWNIYRRFWWDVAAVETCPLHKVRLATSCPVCGVNVTWDAGSLTRCGNGHSLLGCNGVSVSTGETLADAYIVGRLGGMDRANIPILDGLILAEACDAMERFGVAFAGGATGALSKFPPERHSEIHSVGFEIARDWPTAFNAMLDEMARADHVGIGAWGAEQVYGYLYLWAKQLPKGLSGDAIREVLFKHCAARGPVHKTSIIVRHADLSPIGLSDLAKRCGRTPQMLTGYIRALGAWPERTKKGTPIAIAREIADEICVILDRTVRADELPAVLGLAKRQTSTLVAARIFAPAEIHRRAGVKVDVFDREAIAAVLAQLRGAAPTVETAPTGLLPLARASKHTRVDGVRGICGMILEGQLEVRAILKGAPGLAGFLVDPEDIRVARRLIHGGGLTLRQVGLHIGIPTDIVGLIVRSGLMTGTLTSSGEILVKEDVLEAFRANYATTGEIARTVGSGVRSVRKACDDANIKPALVIKGGKVATLWRRSDLTLKFWSELR
ncbi:TniQ family protein [Methylobacterium sp. E-066]|uniref:TniQ family protein n=1 Tax=Methylobacterium sp. E-066 TaxID=2836584 RepID=UPI001FB91C99|nr:TniQ family protein [Methylobacterium sp. E-066]MCJ2142861.1 TniQ family protein [Methylobacterium sp. E-066]